MLQQKFKLQLWSLTIISLPFHIVVDYIFLLVRFCLSFWSDEFDCGCAANLTKDTRRRSILLSIPIRNLHKSFYLCCQLLPLGVQELAVASSTSAYVDEYSMPALFNFLTPVPRIEHDDVGWEPAALSRVEWSKQADERQSYFDCSIHGWWLL